MRVISIIGVLVISRVVAACASEPEATPPKVEAESLVAEIIHANVDGTGRREERLAALPVALATAPPDVVCVQGITIPSEREALRKALTNVLPFSLELPTTDDTAVDDPRGLDGVAPRPPAQPPCAGLEPAMDEALACYAVCLGLARAPNGFDVERCRTTMGCWDERKLDADPERRCPSCVIAQGQMGATSPAPIRDRCLHYTHPLAAEGQHGTMILSRHRLTRPSLRVLPAEGIQRVVLGATLTTPGGAHVDVYCTSLTPTLPTTLTTDPDVTLPYSGAYGSPRDGWLRENELQVEQLGAHVHARREGRPAIVLGNFGASSEVVQWGRVILPASGPVAAKRLGEIFTSGTAPGYVPSCTVCKDNPLAGRWYAFKAESFFNQIYLAGVPQSAVLTSSRSYLGATLAPAETEYNSVRLPISAQYGFRSRIAIAR